MAPTDHGTAYVGSLPRPIESARILLREFRAACTPDVKLHRGDDDEFMTIRSSTLPDLKLVSAVAST